MFDTHTYVERRRRLAEQMKTGLLLFWGNEESPMNYASNHYPFKQDSSFLYFFGLDYPGLVAVIDLDEGTQTVFGDDLTVEEVVWQGTQPTLKKRCERVGIKRAQPRAALTQALDRAKQQRRSIHFLPPYRADAAVALAELLSIPLSTVESASSVKLIKAVVEQRSVKTPAELVEIEKAVDITARMHLEAMTVARAGMLEAELVGAVHRIAIAAGGQLSFPVIMTTHGQTLHNTTYTHSLRSGQMVLHDSGAQTAMGYAGDMSRTFPVDTRFTTRQKEIYSVALKAHQVAVDALRPGVLFQGIHLTACRAIARGLVELGLMKGDADEAVAAGAHALFFPCGTGHMVGLDVHDMENLGEQYVGYGDGMRRSEQFGLKYLRLARMLEPGFVVTIEPGIYFIPELIDLWAQEKRHEQFIAYDKLAPYRDFGGLRNEEDFVITEQGARLLGQPVPKSIDAIEAIRSR